MEGCESCALFDFCEKCVPPSQGYFSLVEGLNFAYCMIACPVGTYRRTLYDMDYTFTVDYGIPSRPRMLSPYYQLLKCTDCPSNCQGCVYDEFNLEPFCYVCKGSHFLNRYTNQCDSIPTCASSQFYDSYDNQCVECPANCVSC
mmetsp:Transcript_34225/g.33461  ORF Transcript_34225/g.33461 Transcript_34225/m.33461 type:complete len:144 (+) Transcript_34225:872-1303(+)